MHAISEDRWIEATLKYGTARPTPWYLKAFARIANSAKAEAAGGNSSVAVMIGLA
jgi:hypothetical protein